MVKNNNLKLNKKYGFSLFEACVVMLVVSVFLAVSASVIPHRPKAKPEAEAHGRFECYYKDGQLWQQQYVGTGNTSSGGTAVTKCRFNPPVYAKYIVVNAVGGGAGGSGGNGGEPGKFYSAFYSAARKPMVVKPGSGGAAGVDGGDTKVYYENEEGATHEPIVTAEGGKSNRELSELEVEDIKQCGITAGVSTDDTNIACGSIPRCEIKNGKIFVGYCFSSSNYRTKYLDLQDDIVKRDSSEFLIPPTLNTTDSTVTYYDQSLLDEYGIKLKDYLGAGQSEVFKAAIRDSFAKYYPSLFTMVLTFDLHKSSTATPSVMKSYLEGMGLPTDSGMGKYSHGQGGAPSGAGTSGAVIFTW